MSVRTWFGIADLQEAIAKAALREEQELIRDIIADNVPNAAALTARHVANQLVSLGLTRDLLAAGLSPTGLDVPSQQEWTLAATGGELCDDLTALVQAGFAVSPFAKALVEMHALRDGPDGERWQDALRALQDSPPAAAAARARRAV